ncbi:GNAT family N-acetyltransferase [Gemmatimonas aurantiaca]|nr:GNAT family N-acetyltransferase [Gemmatimonas aurantiaca]
MNSDLEIRLLTASDVRQMRHTVLRPHQPPEKLIYPKDDISQTFHLGGYIDGLQVGIASFLYDDHSEIPDPGYQYRIRGMATLPKYRSNKIGAKLVEEGLRIIKQNFSEAPEEKMQRVWCNARESAFGFYERCGFQTLGGMFEIEGIGPHKIMWREV